MAGMEGGAAGRPDAWPEWFRAQGMEMPDCAGAYFEQFTAAAQAAEAGLGSALIPAFLLERELALAAVRSRANGSGTALSSSGRRRST